MNLYSMNCRGGGNPRTVRDIATVIQSHSPSLVFLCETRQKSEKMKRLRNRFGLRGYTGIDSEGMGGGLALYWNESIQVDVEEVTSRYIDVLVQASDGPRWRFTCTCLWRAEGRASPTHVGQYHGFALAT
jgi:hypothetical protein